MYNSLAAVSMALIAASKFAISLFFGCLRHSWQHSSDIGSAIGASIIILFKFYSRISLLVMLQFVYELFVARLQLLSPSAVETPAEHTDRILEESIRLRVRGPWYSLCGRQFFRFVEQLSTIFLR